MEPDVKSSPSSSSSSKDKSSKSSAGCSLLSAVIFICVTAALMYGAIMLKNYADTKNQQVINQAKQAELQIADPDPNAPVTCDNVPMSQSQTCDHVISTGAGGSVTEHYSYEEQKDYQANQRIEAARAKQPTDHSENNGWNFLSIVLILVIGLLALFLLFNLIALIAWPVKWLKSLSQRGA